MVVHDSPSLNEVALGLQVSEKALLAVDQLLAFGCMVMVANNTYVVSLGHKSSATSQKMSQGGVIEPRAARYAGIADALIEVSAVDVYRDPLFRWVHGVLV